jgi:hypothetical protein
MLMVSIKKVLQFSSTSIFMQITVDTEKEWILLMAESTDTFMVVENSNLSLRKCMACDVYIN